MSPNQSDSPPPSHHNFEPDQVLDDWNKTDTNKWQFQTPVLTQDHPDQEEGTDEHNNPEYFDPSSLDRREQREVAQAAELDATLRALSLSQPEQPSTDADAESGEPPAAPSHINSIKVTQDFIKEICAATLDNGNMDDNLIDRLRNPCEQPADISDPDIRFSLDLFLAITNASEETYKLCRDAILRRYPESGVLSYHSVKKLVAEISGVVAVYDDMCINSCHVFTGPFSQLESCNICGEARYDATNLVSTARKA